VICPAGADRKAPATVCAICASVSPYWAATSRFTWTSRRGTLAARVVVTSATPLVAAIACCTCWVACCSTSWSAACTSTESSLPPRPELLSPKVTSPIPLIASNWARSLSVTTSASALSASATWKLAWLAPELPANGLKVPLPTVTW
jgi:hypothetical protein